MKLDDNTSLSITCPACGKQIHGTVGWLKQPGRACPHCNTPFHDEVYRKGLSELEQKLSTGLLQAGQQISEALRKLGIQTHPNQD